MAQKAFVGFINCGKTYSNYPYKPLLLLDLSIVEKLIPTTLINRYNQTIIMKVASSKDNLRFLRHVRRQSRSIRKLRKKTLE
jgi:hypothetical protein